MKKLFFFIFQIIFFFSFNTNASEIDSNDPYYKLGWKNIENPTSTLIAIPDANASVEIIESEIYLDEKEDIKNYKEYLFGQETSIDDIAESLIISDRNENYTIKVEYNDAGYVTSDRFKNFTPSNLIDTLNKRTNESINKITWLLEPDLSENKISDYGIRVDWEDGEVTYEYYSTILGREGYIELKINLFGDGTETEDYFNYYESLLKAVSSTVKFKDKYNYSDYAQDDYMSPYTLTNIIDGSYGEGIATDPTILGAYCLITTGALKKAGITKEDYPRFAGKVIFYYVTDTKKEIIDFSEDDETSVLSGMYGIQDKQKYKKTNIYTSNSQSYDINYTNIIEVNGDKPKNKIKYDYKNKLRIQDGKPVLLFLNIDQTGLSFNKWNLTLGCRDYEYTKEELADAKIDSSNFDPKNFKKLMEKLKERGAIEDNQKSTKFKIKYSLFIEEDFDTVLFFESPYGKGNKSVKIITYGGYEFFNGVYSRNDSSAETFVQPASFKKSGDMESYMKEGFKIKDFEWKFNLRDGDEIMESSNVNYTNNIEAYIASNTSFTVATINEGWWYAGTFKLVNNIEDFHEIYKKNKSTYCGILKEELVKNSKNQNIQYNYSDFVDFNKRNNINC